MKASFRLVLFINILISTAVVILANRLAIQIFLPLQIKDELKNELIAYIDECGKFLPDHDDFQSCIQGSQKMSLIKGFTGRYVLCTGKNSKSQNDACSGVFNHAIKWNAVKDVPEKDIKFTELEIEKTSWLAARFQADAKANTIILLSLDEVSLEVSRMLRVYRDRNTVYVLPILLLVILLMTWHVFSVAMRPVRQLDESIKTLDLKSFEFKTALVAPYKEFQNLVSSFENLRLRLIQSFEKARRFASDASHELRTPLTILRGNAEALIKDFPVGSAEQIRMQMLTSEIDRLVTITQKLLWLSRADANKLMPVFQEVNLSDLLNQWLLDARTFNPNLKLIGEIQSSVKWKCDHDLIHQLIGNLYDNAVKYNIADGWIRFRLQQDAQGICLSIENPSLPLPADFTKQAFDRFYRGDDARSRSVDGLGLGLSLCQEIAAVHQAQLSVKVTDEGTVIFALNALMPLA
jgi:two-component system heavy metal sensor histidine kinase CusS